MQEWASRVSSDRELEHLTLCADELGHERFGRVIDQGPERPAPDDPTVAHQEDFVAEPTASARSWVTMTTVFSSDRKIPRGRPGARRGPSGRGPHRLVEQDHLGVEHRRASGSLAGADRPRAGPGTGRVRRRETGRVGHPGQPLVDPPRFPARYRPSGPCFRGGQMGEKAAILDDVSEPVTDLEHCRGRQLLDPRS